MRNEYENDVFFTQYARMPRSKEGLSAAGSGISCAFCCRP